MQLTRSWLALLGIISLSLLGSVAADAQIADPNLAVIRLFNIVLTDNTKLIDKGCCMGVPAELPSVQQYQCFAHQALEMGKLPGSPRLGIQYCHHLPDGSSPDQARDIFKDVCTKNTGEWIEPDADYCPQIWENFRPDYKKKTPPPPPASDPAPPPPPPVDPDENGKNTNDKDGFKTEGSFNYALVDYAITRSIACCKTSTKPIIKPNKYKCAQRKTSNSVFMKQCASILPTITRAKKINGYTTIGNSEDDGQIVDDDTKKQCSSMWTNAISYTYGFCKLEYDFAIDEATKAFQDDCTAKGGELKDPHNGMCLWNVDDAASGGGSGTA